MNFSKSIILALAFSCVVSIVEGKSQARHDFFHVPPEEKCLDRCYDDYSDCIANGGGCRACDRTARDCGDDCYDRRNRNRRILKVKEPSVWLSHECANENYKLSVTVEGKHVGLVGEPKCEGSLRNAECQECPTFVFHTITESHDGLSKQVHIDNREFDGFELGSFPLTELVQAHEGASISNEKYSLFQNNCASYVIDFLHGVNVNPMNRRGLKFVSRKLAQAKLDEELKEKGVENLEDFVSAYVEKRN